MPDVLEVTTQEELESRRLDWKLLAAKTRAPHICHSIDWIQLAMEHHYPQEWRVLFVYIGRKPIGIVPLTVSERRTPFGRFRVLAYPQPLHAPWYSPIGPNPAATLTAAMYYIHDKMEDWDVLYLEPVGQLAGDFQRTPTAMRLAGMDVRKRIAERFGAIQLDSLGQAFQSDLYRQLSRTQAELESDFGRVTFQRFRPQGAMFDDTDLPAELLLPDEQSDPDEAHFLQHAREIAVSEGMLDVTRLQAGTRTLGVIWGFCCAGQVTDLRAWLPPDTPPTVIEALMVRLMLDSLARGDETLYVADPCLGRWCNASFSVESYAHIQKTSLRARASCWLPEAWSVLSP